MKLFAPMITLFTASESFSTLYTYKPKQLVGLDNINK